MSKNESGFSSFCRVVLYGNFTLKMDPKKFYSKNYLRSTPDLAYRYLYTILTLVCNFNVLSKVSDELSYFIVFSHSKKIVLVTHVDLPNFDAVVYISPF
jgi:hypothetical protein